MPMRRDCRHYESRTFADGEAIERCKINLAPEAPWRCPDDCPGYSKRMIDAGWQYGSMARTRDDEPDRPEPEGADVAALLDEVQFVVNSAAADVAAEGVGSERRGLFRRKKARGKAKDKKGKKGRKKRRS